MVICCEGIIVERMVVAVTTNWRNGRYAAGKVTIMGRTLSGFAIRGAGLALTVGLHRVDVELVKSRPTNNERSMRMVIRRQYKNLHYEAKRRRWEAYGAPLTPHPEQILLNAIRRSRNRISMQKPNNDNELMKYIQWSAHNTALDAMGKMD